MSQYPLPRTMVGPNNAPIFFAKNRPASVLAPLPAAAAASSARPSPASSALMLATRSAVLTATAGPKPTNHIPNIEMLTANILDPISTINATSKPVVSASRFRPVPREDALICDSDGVRTVLRPHEYPSFIPPNAPISLKLLGVLEREGLGKIDKTSGQDVTLYRWVNDKIRELEAAPEEESKSEEPPAEARGSDLSGVKQKFYELKSNPAHGVFPISVTLALKKKEELQLVSRLHADGHRNTVWPNAIQHYQPFKLFGDDPFVHYESRVIRHDRDPHFDVGLFGECSNGLSMVLLALAKSSNVVKKSRKAADAAAASSSTDELAGNDKLKKVLYHFITMVALQYWTLVHRRWMELNPATAKDATKYLPEFMFIFHHSTDFTQSFKDTKRERKGDKKKSKKEKPTGVAATEAASVQLPPMRDTDDLHQWADGDAFIPFLEAVFEYVIDKMTELEESEEEDEAEISSACKKLALSRKTVREHCKTISTNHTQFFVCSRLKMHIVPGLVDIINDGVHSDTSEQSLGFQETKFFARNKDQLKMYIPKAANEAATAGNNRYNNPYFWSHLTFQPMQGIVIKESTLEDGELWRGSVHQACALRRLLFIVNGSDATTILGALVHVGDCTFRFVNSPETVTLTAKAFIDQFIYTKKFTSMSALHADRVDQQVCLPAVAKPAALRYCVQFEDEIGRAYIPSISRDLASFPVSDEHDILSMTQSYFLASSTSKNIIENETSLLAMGVLSKNPVNLCTRFASSRLTLKTFPVLKQLGGLSRSFTKLCPDDDMCDLVYIDGSLRLTEGERAQLRYIAKSQGHFVAVDAWKLLQKITASDSDAISSFLFHAHRSEIKKVKKEEAKMDEGNGHAVVASSSAAAAAVSVQVEYPREWVLGRLAALKSDWEKAQQAAVLRFRRVWGAMIPSSNRDPKKRKSSDQESQDDWVENQHWPAQERFISKLRAEWNYCDRPVVSSRELALLLSQMMKVDLGQFQITLFKSESTEGGIKISEDKLKMFLCGSIISQIEQTGATPSYSLTSIATDDGWDCTGFTDHEIMFTGNEQSLLGKKFAEFFPPPNGLSARRYATTLCNIEIAFFMWYYSTVVVQPFVDNLPRLFPISSVIKQKLQSSIPPQSWVQTLVPSDGTPHLTSLMFKLSADMCKAEIHRELDTSLARGTKISSKAQAMLQVMQTVIQAQDLTDPTRNEDSKLEAVSQLAAQLLSGVQKPAAAAASSSSFQPRVFHSAVPVTRMKALEDEAFRVIIQQLKVFPILPSTTIHKLFDDISAMIDIDRDVMDVIVALLKRVQGTLLAQQSLQPALTVFQQSIRQWEKPESPALLRSCAVKFIQACRRN